MISTHKLVHLKVADLFSYDRNARTHGEAQIAQLAASIKEFGFTCPVLIDEKNVIVAGEGRWRAAQKLIQQPAERVDIGANANRATPRTSRRPFNLTCCPGRRCSTTRTA